MTLFRDVQPHGAIQQVFENVFMVTGSNSVHFEGLHLQTSRNMMIVRQGRDLSLINTVRLNDEGLASLEELGEIKHVLRIGAFHGYDDPFYLDRYKATFWATQGMTHEHAFKTDKELEPDGPKPFENCQVFNFKTTTMPESILNVKTEKGHVLITCDSIQNWTEQDPFISDSTYAMFVEQRLIKTANIPATWLGACKPDFKELMTIKDLDFQHLLSAHGKPLLNHAHEKVVETLDSLIGNS